MDIKEEVKKVEAEMKMLQERFLILTGAKQALTNVLNAFAGAPLEQGVKEEDVNHNGDGKEEFKGKEP